MSSFLVVREKFCLLIVVVSLIFLSFFLSLIILFVGPNLHLILSPNLRSNSQSSSHTKRVRYLTSTVRGQKQAIPKFACSNETFESEICKLAVSASSFAACWRFGSTNGFRYGLCLSLAARMRPQSTGTLEIRWLNLRPSFLPITSPPFNH